MEYPIQESILVSGLNLEITSEKNVIFLDSINLLTTLSVSFKRTL